MGRNVEIKARVVDPARLAARVRDLATSGPQELTQHDVFFNCRQGRLKMRLFADGHGELIAYQRADHSGPKTSLYQLVPCAEPQILIGALTSALGILGEVRKSRTLWFAGRTRIHLDNVDGLGHFVELEVVLEKGEAEEDGWREADDLMKKLNIDQAALLPTAYIDLLAARQSG